MSQWKQNVASGVNNNLTIPEVSTDNNESALKYKIKKIMMTIIKRRLILKKRRRRRTLIIAIIIIKREDTQ